MARNKEFIVLEMMKLIDFALNDEWAEKCLDDFDEWLTVHGSSEHSIKTFANQFNNCIAETEDRFLSMAEGD